MARSLPSAKGADAGSKTKGCSAWVEFSLKVHHRVRLRGAARVAAKYVARSADAFRGYTFYSARSDRMRQFSICVSKACCFHEQSTNFSRPYAQQSYEPILWSKGGHSSAIRARV